MCVQLVIRSDLQWPDDISQRMCAGWSRTSGQDRRLSTKWLIKKRKERTQRDSRARMRGAMHFLDNSKWRTFAGCSACFMLFWLRLRKTKMKLLLLFSESRTPQRWSPRIALDPVCLKETTLCLFSYIDPLWGHCQEYNIEKNAILQEHLLSENRSTFAYYNLTLS